MTRTSERRWALYYYVCGVGTSIISAITFVDGLPWLAFWESIAAAVHLTLALKNYRRSRTLT